MPEKALDATMVAPLREGASMLQAAAARLTALTTGVDGRFDAAVGRLQSLPAAARLDPFEVLANAGGAAPGPASSTRADRDGGGPPLNPRNGKPAAATASPASGPRPAAPLQRMTQHSAGNEPGISSAVGLPARLLTRITEHVALASRSARGQGGSATTPRPGPPARSGTVRPASSSADMAGSRTLPVHDEALVQGLREAIVQMGVTAKAAMRGLPILPPKAATTPLPAEHLEQLLRKLSAGPSGSAPDRTQQRTASRRSARPPADQAPTTPTPVLPVAAPARRAPSLLLGSTGAVAGGAVGVVPRASPAASPSNAAAPSGLGPSPQVDTDDVIAEINRLLVDQAWMRGVDLR